MGMSDLPDMYAQSLRATGPRAEGIHIKQIMRAHVHSYRTVMHLHTFYQRSDHLASYVVNKCMYVLLVYIITYMHAINLHVNHSNFFIDCYQRIGLNYTQLTK